MYRTYRRPYGTSYPSYSRDGRRGNQLIHLLATLAYQISRIPNKPTITLILIALNALLYFRPDDLPGVEFLPSIRSGCLIPHAVLREHEWPRLFWSPLLHYDYPHLYYNLVSFLWKGSQLEPRIGGLAFGALIVELGLIGGLVHVALAWLLSMWSHAYVGKAMMSQCSIGFSGILFGLKVILTHDQPGWSEVFGMTLPTKYTAWLELVVAQMLTPGVSFLGHLSGIIAGLLHVILFSRIWHFFETTSSWRVGRRNARPLFTGSASRRPRVYGHGRVG